MPRVVLTLESDVKRTARVMQVEGFFDVPSAEKNRVSFDFDAPLEAQPWKVGLITGPSGAGKSSVARHLFGDALVTGYTWPDGAMIDAFDPTMPFAEVTKSLASVGFSSPPNWLRPFSVLSTGEKFRAEMARALVDPRPLVVVDEFTSVVDRTVGKTGACAVAKSVRAREGKQFVAVTCHSDVEEWLQPDWVCEPHLGRFAWRSLQRRPSIAIDVYRCDYASWSWFSAHHYMSAALHRSCKCFVGFIEGQPAAFASYLHMPHPSVKDLWSFNRVVIRPEFQALGLGTAGFIDPIAAIGKTNGKRVLVHPAHPGQIAALSRAPNWKMTNGPAFANGGHGGATMKHFHKSHAHRRRVAHFEYIGPPLTGPDATAARRLWE